jgi:ankyrin repeat protein
MLLAIDETYKSEVRRALLWLVFSGRPLKIEELAEAACIDPDADPPFSEDDRFHDPCNNILEILGSFVSLDRGGGVRLAHFSVKEYLLSSRLRTVQFADFGLSEMDAHLFCARSCLSYILQERVTPLSLYELPFVAYACDYWHLHAARLPEDSHKLHSLVEILYRSQLLYKDWQSMLSWHSSLPGFNMIDLDSLNRLSPLCHAAAMGLTSIFEELMAEPESFYARHDSYPTWTPLHTAALFGKKKTVDRVLQLTTQSPIVDLLTPHGSTALHLAASKGDDDIVSVLLQYGASTEMRHAPGRSTIELAAASGHLKIVQMLLNHGITEEHKVAALFSATEADYVSIVETLLEHGASLDATNNDGQNLLFSALARGSTNTFGLLLKRGANVDCLDQFDSTPLHRAVQKGNEVAVELLLQAHTDLKLRDADGKTAFGYACARGNPKILKLFLQKAVDISAEDGWGKTPLHYLAWAWDADAMQLLLDRGVELEARTPRGETALQLAAQCGGSNVVECLLKNGADITSRNHNARTALHFAVRRGNREVLQVLLKYGADPRVRDNRGMKPLDAYGGYEEGGIRIRRVG